MKREYYEDIGYKPFLFYVIFGVAGEELEVSRSKHHVDEFPQGLAIQTVSRPQNAEYMDNLLGGELGKILKSSDRVLYEACQNSDKCAIIQGTVQNDSTFDYMRNVIGIIEAFIEKGAVGVLDLLTFNLIAPERWTEKIFEQEINAQNHAVILCSEEKPSTNGKAFWLHTRGMAEFGRPDIGIHNVPADKLADYKQVIDQMIFYGGQGLFFKEGAKLHTHNGKTFIVKTDFVNDFNNFDYNNAYYNVTVEE